MDILTISALLGSGGVSGWALFMAKLLKDKLIKQDDKIERANARTEIVERDLLKYQIHANQIFVDKLEYMNTMNKFENKLDKVNDSVNELKDKLLTNS